MLMRTRKLVLETHFLLLILIFPKHGGRIFSDLKEYYNGV